MLQKDINYAVQMCCKLSWHHLWVILSSTFHLGIIVNIHTQNASFFSPK